MAFLDVSSNKTLLPTLDHAALLETNLAKFSQEFVGPTRCPAGTNPQHFGVPRHHAFPLAAFDGPFYAFRDLGDIAQKKTRHIFPPAALSGLRKGC